MYRKIQYFFKNPLLVVFVLAFTIRAQNTREMLGLHQRCPDLPSSDKKYCSCALLLSSAPVFKEGTPFFVLFFYPYKVNSKQTRVVW